LQSVPYRGSPIAIGLLVANLSIRLDVPFDHVCNKLVPMAQGNMTSSEAFFVE
jgi:hypothetical protein